MEINLELPTSPCSIASYKDAFDRILGNLISNAIKFSPPGSQVDIRVATLSGNAEVHIEDHGPGIAAAELPLLFRKFSRLTPRPTGGESSTGLGLYIVKLLVEQTQGNIEVNSTLGQGSQFKLKFPLVN